MNSAYERLKAVIIALGYTSNEKFEDTVGLGHGFVSRITNRVSSKSLQAITRKFPQVNPSYIRTGMGEMFISSPIKVSENENAKTRLREYLKYKGITKREFCDKADVASNFPIIGKNGVFTARVSYRVNSKFPDLNMDWLANGAGEMLQPEANIEKFNNYKSRIAPFCTEMGMNSVDIYECVSYNKGVLAYDRAKTRDRRNDNAHIEIVVPDIIKPLFRKYKGTTRAFDFYQKYSNAANFNKHINKGLHFIADELGIPRFDFYSARHTWASIARNKLGIDKYTIHEALNHVSQLDVTDIYIQKDFTNINKANEKVVEYVMKMIGEAKNDV